MRDMNKKQNKLEKEKLKQLEKERKAIEIEKEYIKNGE